MSLTYQNIWEQYSHVEFNRRVYIKRLQEDGTYEGDFTEISNTLLKDDSVSSLRKTLPNSSWEFGKVIVSNANMNILSPFQEFASEKDANSLFAGYIRHRSIIKVVDSLIDKYTDPDVPAEASVTTFLGLIDSLTATTEQGYETFTALDFMSVLSEINVKELTLTETTLNDLVYEIMNRTAFTKFFNVSNSTTYINAGYNATNIDTTQYDGTVLEMLQDLAKGHSIFYIDPDDNYFYFEEVTPTATVVYNFLEENNRKLKISSFREGVDRQFTHLYWEGTNNSSVKFPEPVNPRTLTVEVKGVTNDTQRDNLLDFILNKTKDEKPYFKLELPYFPIIKLLDRVIIQSFGQAPFDAVRWGMFQWTSGSTTNPSEAPRWRKPAGIRISADDQWMVRGITHNKTLKTTLEVEKIITGNV